MPAAVSATAHTTTGQPCWTRSRAYAAANWVLPTPRCPANAHTTTVRSPCAWAVR